MFSITTIALLAWVLAIILSSVMVTKTLKSWQLSKEVAKILKDLPNQERHQLIQRYASWSSWFCGNSTLAVLKRCVNDFSSFQEQEKKYENKLGNDMEFSDNERVFFCKQCFGGNGVELSGPHSGKLCSLCGGNYIITKYKLPNWAERQISRLENLEMTLGIVSGVGFCGMFGLLWASYPILPVFFAAIGSFVVLAGALAVENKKHGRLNVFIESYITQKV